MVLWCNSQRALLVLGLVLGFVVVTIPGAVVGLRQEFTGWLLGLRQEFTGWLGLRQEFTEIKGTTTRKLRERQHGN